MTVVATYDTFIRRWKMPSLRTGRQLRCLPLDAEPTGDARDSGPSPLPRLLFARDHPAAHTGNSTRVNSSSGATVCGSLRYTSRGGPAIS